MIPELDRAILDYKFHHAPNNKFRENDLKERELLELIERESEAKETRLNCLLTTYSLTPVDFMILAKTSLNYAYCVGRGFEIKDLPLDLKVLLKGNDLYQSREYIQAYRKSFEENLLAQKTIQDGQYKRLLGRRL